MSSLWILAIVSLLLCFVYPIVEVVAFTPPAYFVLRKLFLGCRNLLKYVNRLDNNGFCYTCAFSWTHVAVFFLGCYPEVYEVNLLYFICNFKALSDDYCNELGPKSLHLVPRKRVVTVGSSQEDVFIVSASMWRRMERERVASILFPGTTAGLRIKIDDQEVAVRKYCRRDDIKVLRYGSAEQFQDFAETLRQYSRVTPTNNQFMGDLSRMINPAALEAPLWRGLRKPHLLPLAQRKALGDQTAITAHALSRKMDAVSAMEASKVLLSGTDVLGSADERVATAMDCFTEGIATSVPPSSPAYMRLLQMLGPLRYSPRIEAHRAAATIRRAALNHAVVTLEGAIVGLISPSKAELHAFPRAVVWQYQDALDLSRQSKHCSLCKSPECAVLREAGQAGRIYRGNDWHRAAGLFKHFAVSAFVMINIEPNINATTLTDLMVASEVYSALSLATVDWRVIMGRKVTDSLTGMTTELAFGQVVSSFKDGGDYVQPLTNVKQMFAPTYSQGHALRRTVIFGDGASQWYDLTLAKSGWATRCLPSYDDYYFIRLILPDLSRPVVLVEKKGFDRVLATYRTQAIKDPSVARIVLRQSVVTYSISGTQVTPRIALSATESEALAVWIVVYSEVQDRVSEMSAGALRPTSSAKQMKSSVFAAVGATLAASAPGVMALGAASSVDALLRVYRSEMDIMTLDQLSERAMEEHFGVKVDPLSLQNVVISAWKGMFSWVTSPAKWMECIARTIKDSWCVSFSYVDLLAVASILGVRLTVDSCSVLIDCISVVARVTGKTEVLRSVTSFRDYLSWSVTKGEKFWVACQSAQDLDFQAAVIDIVDTFFNVFGVDHAEAVQKIRESDAITAEEAEELAANDALPFSDFMSEIKLFLGKFNSHVKRFSMSAMLLNAFHHDCRHASAEQKARMIHMLKAEVTQIPQDTKRSVLGFALTGKVDSMPIPLRPIEEQNVRKAFEKGVLRFTTQEGEVTLTRLPRVNDLYDFSKIHALMDLQHTDQVNPANIRGPNYISPDERGGRIQFALVKHVSEMQGGAELCHFAAMKPWHTAQLANPSIDYVDKVLRTNEKLFSMQSEKNWIAHITGLAMGGKSKTVRDWVTSNDLVVVPTRELKSEWQDNLGKLDPVKRASVVTQHEALEVKYAARFVLIDECYTFDPEHLQAIANRQRLSKGVITIGDRRQIANVFSPTANRLSLRECPCVMITPTTFMGWDAAAVYLTSTTTDVPVANLFVGTETCESLRYTQSADDTLLPGEGDLAMQGTQIGKEMAKTRGLTVATVHECQGRRSDHTIIHAVGRTLLGDLNWLSKAEQSAHMGVAISRARLQTIFVVDGLESLKSIYWFDDTSVNGALPSTVMLGGTSWDLVEPRTESESVWEHLHVQELEETGLTEVALTDPVTVATIEDVEGEPVSTSEIRTNVELSGVVTFSDMGIPNSDNFDNYCVQPRDVPGAELVQALTRASPDVVTTPEDYINAEKIVSLIFDEVIDKKMFFAHLSNSRRAAIKRQTRQQVIDGAYANVETAASSLSFAFLKPEFAKKPSVLKDGPSELKAQGVVTASAMQQTIFLDACDDLTHAWARSMRVGKLSPVGLRESEVEDFLATFENSYELDIEKQDSSHKPVHIIVASIFLEMASDKLGLGKLAHEIRNERRVRMMSCPFKFVLHKSLASGDPWTLIINKIMAFSSLISVANLRDVKICQSGDDVTLDRQPDWRQSSLRDQLMANKGITWKAEERSQRQSGVTFISRAVLQHRTVVYKALRTILKYAYRRRNQIQHAGIEADAKRIERLASRWGLQAYAEARAQVWGGDPVVIFDMWTRALAIARLPFTELPEHLKSEEPRQYTIREKDGGCFGYALANCVKDNVQAVNAIASFRGPVNQTTALDACRDNGVPCIIFNEEWAVRSRKRLIVEMDRRKISRSFVVIYRDHAVAVVPNTITLHGAMGKRVITWKSHMGKDVEITEFE